MFTPALQLNQPLHQSLGAIRMHIETAGAVFLIDYHAEVQDAEPATDAFAGDPILTDAAIEAHHRAISDAAAEPGSQGSPDRTTAPEGENVESTQTDSRERQAPNVKSADADRTTELTRDGTAGAIRGLPVGQAERPMILDGLIAEPRREPFVNGGDGKKNVIPDSRDMPSLPQNPTSGRSDSGPTPIGHPRPAARIASSTPDQMVGKVAQSDKPGKLKDTFRPHIEAIDAGRVTSQALSANSVPKEALLPLETPAGSTATAADRTKTVSAAAPLSGTAVAVQGAPDNPVYQISTRINGATGESIEVALNPPELGSVRITVTTDGDRVHLSCSVDRPETLELLRRSSAELRGELLLLGYQSASLTFSHSEHRRDRWGDPENEKAHSVRFSGDQEQVEGRSDVLPANGRLDIRL